jgi:hypothetical protein
MRQRNFEDEFDELTFYLRKIFNQRQTLVNSTQLQRRAQAVLRLDRYNVITLCNEPRYVVIDARMMDKIRLVMVKMGYIQDRPVYGESLPDPRKLPDAPPDRISFTLEDSDDPKKDDQ